MYVCMYVPHCMDESMVCDGHVTGHVTCHVTFHVTEYVSGRSCVYRVIRYICYILSRCAAAEKYSADDLGLCP